MKRVSAYILYIFILLTSCESADSAFVDSESLGDNDAVSTSVCGNRILEEGETCDSTEIECGILDPDIYQSGRAKCSDDCSGYDISSCIKVYVCGNDLVEPGEICDGNAKDCAEIDPEKYTHGKAPCYETCSGWDTVVCRNFSQCGNGLVEGDEVCESGTRKRCVEISPQVFKGGYATCLDECDGWDYSECETRKCEGVECGSIVVVENDFTYELSCGECAPNEFCNEAKQCIMPCEGRCGELSIYDPEGNPQSFTCRDCFSGQFCDSDNYCQEACVNMECGTDNGVDCGQCSEGYYCSIYPNRCRKMPFIEDESIPEGDFWMGCNFHSDPYCNESEKPYHLVNLKQYRIMKYEVTVEQYEKCIDSGFCNNTSEYGFHYNLFETNFRCNIGSDRDPSQPANCVNYYGAMAFCKFIGGRLPTEAEWEKAGRGGCEFYDDCEVETPIFPWGNDMATCDLAVIMETLTGIPGCGTEGTFVVGSKPDGASPYGLFDMAGNVWEWVYDWYDADFYDDSPFYDPSGPVNGTEKVLKGGSSNFTWQAVRPSYRYNVCPITNYTYSGFRCVFDIE